MAPASRDTAAIEIVLLPRACREIITESPSRRGRKRDYFCRYLVAASRSSSARAAQLATARNRRGPGSHAHRTHWAHLHKQRRSPGPLGARAHFVLLEALVLVVGRAEAGLLRRVSGERDWGSAPREESDCELS